MTHPRVTCTVSNKADLDEIIALSSAPDSGTLPRKFSFMNASVSGGYSLTLRDEHGSLIGCSNAFPLCDSAYTEIGGTIIKGPFGSCLYEVFVALHALHIFCCHPCVQFVVGCVSPDRTRLLARLTSDMRWLRFSPLLELIHEEETLFVSSPPAASWIYLPASALIHFVKIALKLQANGAISGRRREMLPINVTSLPCYCEHSNLLLGLSRLEEKDLPEGLGWLAAFQIWSAKFS